MPANPEVGPGRLPDEGGKSRRKKKRKRGHRPATVTNPERIARADRIKRIMDWRIEGHSLKQIGDWENLSPQRVHAIINENLSKLDTAPVEALRKLESERLDLLLTKTMDSALQGNLDAIAAAAALIAQRSKLLGLDAPVKVPVSDENAALSDAKVTLLRKLNTMAERLNAPPKALAEPEPVTIEGAIVSRGQDDDDDHSGEFGEAR